MSAVSQILARQMRLPRAETLDVVCERGLRVPMDDGVTLVADRWVARTRRGVAQPTVLVRSPYGRGLAVGVMLGRMLAERGLQVLVQSVRGTFGSQGEFDPFDERADGLATLRWLRAQPWHAGPIGTIGPSYLGFVQWAIAADAGSDLAAMSVHVTASQFHGQTYAGTSLALENVAAWMVVLAVQERRLGLLAVNRALRRLTRMLPELPLSTLDERATGAPVAWYRKGFEHPGREDPYWVARDFSEKVPQVRAPVQFVGGWYDILLPWMLEDFVALQAAGRAPQLVVGPWSHMSPGLMAASQREGLAWLRAHLLGDDRLVRAAAVRLYVTGERSSGGWREFDAWPPPGVGERRLYLGADGTLDSLPPSAASADGPDCYRYDPRDPTPSLGGPVLMSREPVVDNAPLEARPDVLVYTGAVLDRTLEAIGPVSVELWVRSGTPGCEHFDVFARVCDVDAAGVAWNVCDALTSVGPGRFDQGSDGAWRVSFELWPTAHRFAAGHRIRLLVASGAHPRYARNPGTGEDPAAVRLESMRAVDVCVLRDAAHPSVLVLPAMPS